MDIDFLHDFATHLFNDTYNPIYRSLVSTHVVYERLSLMHYHIPVSKYLVQNFLSAATQVFQECWSGVPPPPPPRSPSENLGRSWHLEFEWVWSTCLIPPPPPSSGSWCVGTNRCIPQGYRLIGFVWNFVKHPDFARFWKGSIVTNHM